jgi:general secretion pathway protein G
MTPTMSRPSRQRGFTLIELMTVALVVSVLAAIALPQYKNAIRHSQEAVLRENLYRMRDLIDQYYADKGKYPGEPRDAGRRGYLRKLPNDPITGQPDWQTELAEMDPDNPGETPGIYNVKSASPESSLAGTPYAEW